MSDKILEAIDAIAVELGVGANGLAFTWDQLTLFNRLLEAHAHELAEEIRAYRVERYGHDHAGAWVSCEEIAQLIDPEVTP